MISIIIPVYNGQSTIDQCLKAIFSSNDPDYECIIVDDSSSDSTCEIAKNYPVRLISLENGPAGPANARNRGADVASGEILFFVDADVILRIDTLAKVKEAFILNPEISALFGSYDNTPFDGGFLSQYKNLIHHFTHQTGRETASTFWSGCGAIRRNIFLNMNGFDSKRYPRPSIEDIELGYRLRAAGGQILLCKNIQVTHLKSWSMIGLLKTDIFYRAFPWAELILQYRFLPNDLNLGNSQRLTTLLLLGIISYLISFTSFANIFLLFLMVGFFLSLITNWVWYHDITNFFMGQKGETRTYFLMSSICLVALNFGMNQLLLPLTVLLPIHLFGRFINTSNFWRRSIFALMAILIISEFILLLFSIPIIVYTPLFIFLIIVILLNYRLYLFLTRNRGFMFALASLPLQLFYYLYSVSAFFISGGLLIWNNLRNISNGKNNNS